DDLLELREFGEQRGSAFAKDLVKLVGIALAGALHVFDGDLQRKERILELVGKAARQLAPGGDALGLNEALALGDQLAGHAVEGAGKLADFVVGRNVNSGGPIAGGDAAGAFGEAMHGTGDAGGEPPTEGDADQNSGGRDRNSVPEKRGFQFG